MKAFFFSLDTVLSYKEQILENLKGEHARALMKVRECEQEIERLARERAECGKKLEESRLEGITIKEIGTYANYMEALRIRIEDKKQELVVLKQQEEEKKNQVIEAKKETSSIDKLKEHKVEEYNKQVQKEEELFIEEFVSTKNAMEKLNG